MSDFAGWLKNLTSDNDAELRELQDFAAANAVVWPYGSNEIRDFVPVVAEKSTDATRNQLLSTLARCFAEWKSSKESAAPNIRIPLVSQIGENFGLFLLTAFGLIVGISLIVGIFWTDFLNSVAKTEQARGLITFLFSFTTISIFILVAIATFWMNEEETIADKRFEKAKDLLTMMLGIFGTIIGFYYGSLVNHANERVVMSLKNIRIPEFTTASESNTIIGATVLGGIEPLYYDIYLNDPTDKIR